MKDWPRTEKWERSRSEMMTTSGEFPTQRSLLMKWAGDVVVLSELLLSGTE